MSNFLRHRDVRLNSSIKLHQKRKEQRPYLCTRVQKARLPGTAEHQVSCRSTAHMYRNQLQPHRQVDRLHTSSFIENPHACVEVNLLYASFHIAAQSTTTLILTTGLIKMAPHNSTSNFGHLRPRIGKIAERNNNVGQKNPAPPYGKTHVDATFLKLKSHYILRIYFFRYLIIPLSFFRRQ